MITILALKMGLVSSFQHVILLLNSKFLSRVGGKPKIVPMGQNLGKEFALFKKSAKSVF